MITLEEARGLTRGQVLYHVSHRNADGTAQRWRVNGEVKTWVRSPEKVKVPVKSGMYLFGYVTERDLNLVCLEDPTIEKGPTQMRLDEAV